LNWNCGVAELNLSTPYSLGRNERRARALRGLSAVLPAQDASAHAGALAALALDDVIALFHQALALAILAFLLLLDVRTFFIRHAVLSATFAAITMIQPGIAVYKPAHPIREITMINRRGLMLSGLLAAALSRQALAAPPSPADPSAIVTAIYSRAAKGKGDGGGAFIIENKAAKAKYLSKALVALWAKADAHTPKGDVGPVDFDPVTNSQEPDVKSFKVATEKQETDKVTPSPSPSKVATRQRARPQTGPSAMSSCARAPSGRSTTSRAPVTASLGRSGPCSPLR
jgi:hypothetical protein